MTEAALIALINSTRDGFRPSPRRDSPEAALACVAAVASAAHSDRSIDACEALVAIGEIIDSAPIVAALTVSDAMTIASKYGSIVEFQAPCLGDVPTLTSGEACSHWFQFWPSIKGISEDWTSRMYDGAWEKRAPLDSISVDDLRRECRLVTLDEADADPAERF